MRFLLKSLFVSVVVGAIFLIPIPMKKAHCVDGACLMEGISGGSSPGTAQFLGIIPSVNDAYGDAIWAPAFVSAYYYVQTDVQMGGNALSWTMSHMPSGCEIQISAPGGTVYGSGVADTNGNCSGEFWCPGDSKRINISVFGNGQQCCGFFGMYNWSDGNLQGPG